MAPIDCDFVFNVPGFVHFYTKRITRLAIIDGDDANNTLVGLFGESNRIVGRAGDDAITGGDFGD